MKCSYELPQQNGVAERIIGHSYDSNTKDVNAVEQQVNTASPDVYTGSLKLNVAGPSVSTASPNEEDTTESRTQKIHKDHPINNVIGEVQSTVQTRRMSKPTSEQGFLSDVYEQKTHVTLNTCFLSQIELTSIAKALIDTSGRIMQEEHLQIKPSTCLILVELPNEKEAKGTKLVFRNKKMKGN
ncbi:hypothetical protein Tco_1274282 [Tanacetum coccineum]